jgi:hypothetical protein
VAKAIPASKLEWVEGGHLIDPAHPVVLSFVDEVPSVEGATFRPDTCSSR